MKRSVAIIGGGSAGLMLAASLDETKFEVSIYEKNPALGRKFLVAGKGGFNLTHAEEQPAFGEQYTPAHFFTEFLQHFSNKDLINWLKARNIPTYTGTSMRVFPEKGIKPIEVLNVFMKELAEKKVKLFTRHTWMGWTPGNQLCFEHTGKIFSEQPDIVVFALGGASWKVTGSDGSWASFFPEKKIHVEPFEASNCACGIDWPVSLLKAAEGLALKNISIRCGAKRKKGEAVITQFGLEGGVVYPLSGELRKELTSAGKGMLLLDLKPEMSGAEVRKRLLNPHGTKSWSKHIQDQFRFDAGKMALLKHALSKSDYMDTDLLASLLKEFPLRVERMAPIDEAISTAGGISLSELDSHCQLIKLPDHYAIGEMLAWDAPTGGYLLQGCLSMGAALAYHLNG
jgi:uncharacterized flavoprotein (TIGR03862 family)